MKEFKIIFLVLAIGFGCSVSAATRSSNIENPTTLLGGLVIAKNLISAKAAVLAVEGNYQYYLKYIKYEINSPKIVEEQVQKKKNVSSSCSWMPWL